MTKNFMLGFLGVYSIGSTIMAITYRKYWKKNAKDWHELRIMLDDLHEQVKEVAKKHNINLDED